jgi:endogenous inhibitor of DNA gyrase (YacG/DUF329 family)
MGRQSLELLPPAHITERTMSAVRQCANCKRRFHVRPQSPAQQFCSRDECQRARRSLWQQERLRSDRDYRENQLRASADWRARNPDYWKTYREKHPDYVERNRAKQKQRASRQRAIAKMDSWLPQPSLLSGTYVLTALATSLHAKMNAWIVHLSVLGAVDGIIAQDL